MYGSSKDYGHLPNLYRGDVQMFYAHATGATAYWQVWNKPPGVTMAYIMCVAGGGGGGGGHCRAAGAAGGGGGSGACSGIASMIIPTVLLPDTLYVSVGQGGQGGAGSAVTGTSGGNGTNGTNSYVSLGHSTAIPMVIIASGVNAPGGGGGGTAAAAGAAGTVPSIITQAALGPIGKMGIFPGNTTAANASWVGLAGVLGGAQTGANGTAITAVWNVIPFSPGSGGGGIATTTDFTGGAITLQAATETAETGILPSAIITAAAAATNGSNGIQLWKPLFGTGGAGGGTSNAGTAGSGGQGAIGCGGGGGGAGLVSGRGGNGGDGIVIITSW